MNKNEEQVAFTKLGELNQRRQEEINAAAATDLPKTYPMNELVKALHPATQYLKVTEIIDHGPDAKSFFFAPDKDKGTTKLATFQPVPPSPHWGQLRNSSVCHPFDTPAG